MTQPLPSFATLSLSPFTLVIFALPRHINIVKSRFNSHTAYCIRLHLKLTANNPALKPRQIILNIPNYSTTLSHYVQNMPLPDEYFKFYEVPFFFSSLVLHDSAFYSVSS